MGVCMRGLKRPICKNGHDKRVVGHDVNYYCKQCRRESDRKRSYEYRRREVPKIERKLSGNFAHSIEWEEARVQAWLAIVAEDKTAEKDFAKRYEQLEAKVPTPENV